MKDVIKCPSCGANVEVAINQKRAFCCHCGSKAFDRPETPDIDSMMKSIEDAMNFGTDIAMQGMQNGFAGLGDIANEFDNMFNIAIGQPRATNQTNNIARYLYSPKDKPAKNKLLDNWVAAKAHLFINADADTPYTYGPKAKELAMQGKFEESYAYAANIAKILNIGGLYALVAGIIKTVFYDKKGNDFYNIAYGLAHFNSTIISLPKLTGQNKENCEKTKAEFIAMNNRYFCLIATKLFSEYNQTNRNQKWFLHTYSRLFHFADILFRMAQLSTYKGNQEFRTEYVKFNSSYSPVLFRLKEQSKKDPIALSKLDSVQKLLEQNVKELGL